ncbi:MAG: ABC transporter permease [Caldilineaceae bacterium]
MNLPPNLTPNPIIVKELRSRMRGGRAFAILTGMLVLLGGALYGLYWIMVANVSYTTLISASIGQTLFSGLALLLLSIICFITPSVTAGAVSSEREKLTYEMLLTTPLRPGSILWGKLIAALSYVFLLIFAAVPLASLVFIFGGVALKEMFKALLVLVAVAVMLGVVGLFFSVWLGRTARATVMSYLFVMLLVVGPLIAYIGVGVIKRQPPPGWLLIPNPISALFSAMMPSLSPNGGGVLMSLGLALSGNLSAVTGMNTTIVRPLYHYSLPFYAALTLLLYGLAVYMIQPIRRRRLCWSSFATVLLVVVLVGGGAVFAFQLTAGGYTGSIFSPLPTPAPFIGVAMPAPAPVRAVEVLPEAPRPDTPLPTPTPALVDGFALESAVDLYAAVVDQLLMDLDLPAETPLLLSRQTDDVVAFIEAPRVVVKQIVEPLQPMLTDHLAETAASVDWFDVWPVELPSTEHVAIVFGGLRPLADGRILVSATAHLTGNRTQGRAYVLFNDGGLQVVETRASWGE